MFKSVLLMIKETERKEKKGTDSKDERMIETKDEYDCISEDIEPKSRDITLQQRIFHYCKSMSFVTCR